MLDRSRPSPSCCKGSSDWPRPVPAAVPLRQLRRGARARVLRRHRRRSITFGFARLVRRLARPAVGAGARRVPRPRAGRGLPVRRPARRGSPPAAAGRRVRADRRLRRRRRRRPDHPHAAAQPETARTGRSRWSTTIRGGAHAAQRAARARRRRATRSTSRRDYGARSVLVAIPSITGEQLRGVRRAAARRRAARAGAAAGRRAARRGATVGHPTADGRRPARPAPGRGRHGGDRRLRHRAAGAGDRRRRLDRLRAVPPAAVASSPAAW